MLFLETSTPMGGHWQWVVKQANANWHEDHFARPLSASQEFRALERLHDSFQQVGGRSRVPEPLALFPEIEAFAMEYVPGRPLRTLLRYRNFVRPRPLLDGITAAAEFIRQVHNLESFDRLPVDLRAEAEAVLSNADEKLQPLGLSLPQQVTRVLSRVPPVMVDARQVWLHGDFYLTNMILANDGSVVGIDASLDAVGSPEDDLVRFVAMMSTSLRFAAEILVPAIGRVRRRLESQLLTSYYGSKRYPPLFELRLIRQLIWRWPRLEQLAQERSTPALLPLRQRAVRAQVRMLMEESSRRLAAQSLGQ